MYKIQHHPILNIPEKDMVTFEYKGKQIKAYKDYTIAAALHQAGFPVHSHSLTGRERSLDCGIGKCGACEMLVDGVVKRICITKVNGVKKVEEIPPAYLPANSPDKPAESVKIYKTAVVIIGAGPAGLACREQLNKLNIPNIVIDNNASIGGQFTMQTHQFFFFEKELKYGGMRGFDIARTIAGDDHSGIMLHSTVWDILEGKRVAVKDILDNSVFYVDADYLVVATGAFPFMPTFENDDLPGVYTAAVFQKMMNIEHTLLGKRILTVGAGNIGYLTSYQAMQAGARVVAIVEAMDHEGGFPVQANRVRRLGIPIITAHTLLKAIPNEDHTGVVGAVIAECRNFKPIPGTEREIRDIDLINVCTGLRPDNQLLEKGKITFGLNAFGVGDAVRVGEGTCAVLRGKQAGMEIAMQMGVRCNYAEYLTITKDYADSQQTPVRVLDKPKLPTEERMMAKPFVVPDCLYGFACNPCSFACPQGAITKTATNCVPVIDYDKCIGCMQCVAHCPGLAIFGYNLNKNWLFLPFEYDAEEGAEVCLVNDNGKYLGDGVIEKITKNPNKTNVARVKSLTLTGKELLQITGFILKERYPDALKWENVDTDMDDPAYVCHCDDVKMETILDAVKGKTIISVDELKHITRIGMGPCRGKRCIPRVKQLLAGYGVEVTGDATPRGPLSNQLNIGEVYPAAVPETFVTNVKNTPVKKVQCEIFVAGGGIAGSALFRYFAEAGKKVVMANADRGSSWRCIAGGRPGFSVPEIADIAIHNRTIFEDLQKHIDIHYKPTRYVTFAHDEATYKSLEASLGWSDGYMVDKKDFQKEVSPYFNADLNTYQTACITTGCWQATPGLVINGIRNIAIAHGGIMLEDCRLVEVRRTPSGFMALVYNHDREYVEYHCEHFVNALGYQADKFARQLGLELGLYPVKHQAFITRRLPLMGINGDALDMLIDRRNYKGFSAVYGQQFGETGQIIGCASPAFEGRQVGKELKYNTQDFLEIASEMFVDWIPQLKNVGFQAFWSGYYTEPRYIVDPQCGLLVGLRGHGFMLGQYLAKIYVDKYLGHTCPSYMKRLSVAGDGLSENAFQ